MKIPLKKQTQREQYQRNIKGDLLTHFTEQKLLESMNEIWQTESDSFPFILVRYFKLIL